MAQQDVRPAQGASKPARIGERDVVGEDPNIDELTVIKTPDGVVFSGRVNATNTADVLRQVEQLLAAAEQSEEERVMDSRREELQMGSEVENGPPPADQQDVLDWDDLIPIAPARPNGRIQVRLKKTGRDRPFPAEDPWAK
jgi:hypothetical protein